MLVFRTIFPLNPAATLQQLIDISIEWIDNSPEYVMREKLGDLYGQKEFERSEGNESFKCFRYTAENNEYACLCFEKRADAEKWRTEYVYKKTEQDVHASCAVYFETTDFQNKLNTIKKPYIMKLLGQKIGFGQDIQFPTLDIPHRLSSETVEHDIERARDIICGNFRGCLPCVYVSVGRDGAYPVNVTTLSQMLSGMAHVFVEPNIYFSQDLRIKTRGMNPYYGAVGIYFPGTTNKKILLPQYEGGKTLTIRKIFDSVKNALNFGYLPDDLSYSDIRALVLQEKLGDLKEQENQDELLSMAFQESEELRRDLNLKKISIEELKEKIRYLESKLEESSDRLLLRGDMIDSYKGQVHDTLVQILEDVNKGLPDGSRKKNILKAVLQANPKVGERKKIEKKLKDIFTGYSSMNAHIKSALRTLGFTVETGGSHLKIYFSDYREMACTLPTSGSDSQRGWKNNLSDLKKKLL